MLEIQKLRMDLKLLSSQINPIRNRIDDLEGVTNFVDGDGMEITKTKTCTIFDADNSSGGGGAGGAVEFSGKVYVAGVLKSLPSGTATDFLKVPFDGSALSYVSDMTMGDGYEVYQLSTTYGDIHESRT